MEKEREPIFESGFSEKQLDKAVDKVVINDQVKPARIATQSVAGGAGSIFDPKKKVVKEKIILDSTSQ